MTNTHYHYDGWDYSTEEQARDAIKNSLSNEQILNALLESFLIEDILDAICKGDFEMYLGAADHALELEKEFCDDVRMKETEEED